MVLGGERAEDARRSSEGVPKRCAKYGLASHTEKTIVVRCGHPQRSAADRQPGTCRLRGVVHSWGKTWRDSATSTRKTESKRRRRTLGECWRWCRDNRPRAPQAQDVLVCAKLRGDDQYDGGRCNSPCLGLVS